MHTGKMRVELSHDGVPFSFVCFDNPQTRSTCRRIFEGSAYRIIRFLQDVRTIVDIGANVGAASIYFALTYPAAVVHAFEPDPDSHRLLVENSQAFANVRPHGYGLFHRDCRKTLHRGLLTPGTSSVGRHYANEERGVEVTLRHAGLALRQLDIAAIDILKIDTEGCEVPILRSAHDLVQGVRALYLEYHSERDRRVIDALLADTHILYAGAISGPHRGELCYVARSAFPSPAHLAAEEIRLEGEEM